MEEYAREPCPYRIVDDCGGAFAMGCIGGGVFQAIKGFRNAPSGLSRRFVSKIYSVWCNQWAKPWLLDRQCDFNQSSITDYCRKFRCLGRNVLNYWLHTRTLQEEGRSMEFNHQWRSDRRNSRSTKWSCSYDWKCNYRRCFVSFNRRCRNSFHEIVSGPIQKSISTRTATRSIRFRRSQQRWIQFWWPTSKLSVM